MVANKSCSAIIWDGTGGMYIACGKPANHEVPVFLNNVRVLINFCDEHYEVEQSVPYTSKWILALDHLCHYLGNKVYDPLKAEIPKDIPHSLGALIEMFKIELDNTIRGLMTKSAGKSICPKCNKTTTHTGRIIPYIDVIYVIEKCDCGFEWRRMYHYIGLTPDAKLLNAFEQNAEVILLLKEAIHNFKEKIAQSPDEYKSYVRRDKIEKIEEK